MAKLRIELEIEVREMTAEEMASEGCPEEFAEPDGEIDAWGIGECIAAMFYDDSEVSVQALAGSNLFIKLGDAELIRASVVETAEV